MIKLSLKRMILFLAGDVMIGRGIDQILPHPSPSQIYEPVVSDAREYISLAEKTSGKINYPVSFDYIWGDALAEIRKKNPVLKIINLETAVSKSENFLPKGINYRANPKNIGVLKALGVDVAVLANNHALDWNREGLLETVDVLMENNIKPVGAGKNLQEAKNPAIFEFEEGRILIFAYAHTSSGTPVDWLARKDKPGINLLRNLSEKEVLEVKNEVLKYRKRDSLNVFSIHWGANWGYEIEPDFIDFAHSLIDKSGIDLVFGHSSHHFKGFEIYNKRLIIYGAGDLINDYEGIAGYEEFRGDLVLIYFPEFDRQKKTLRSLTILPKRIKKFKLNTPCEKDIDWILEILKRESKYKGTLDRIGRLIVYTPNLD